ncbi:dsDNA nuclease domain-containing protein [Stenotrophomonas acidaminiphila]|uniref:dsDNA nuclease domain-containing protein n=1 Tax=Stenotrophomonas acidaminiphila TaxID=128780 RepID=UPI0028A80CBC|nr:dsDNA nuclease domain-containing protein [Stenotrophomonas acidaminiphila]
MEEIENARPEEDVGRNTLSRYDMQFQAAAYAALEILDGKGIERVYCDYHDDFVVQKSINGEKSYHFFQVKTKDKLNYQWTLNDIFALKKRAQKKDEESLTVIRRSFAGKLLAHSINFRKTCNEATFLSNIHFHDEVVNLVDELRLKKTGLKESRFLSENFKGIFKEETDSDTVNPTEALSKISLIPAVTYISKDREAFASSARNAIFKYSEIDLNFNETNELANGLVDLVYKKSRTPLAGVKPDEIASRISVNIDDLLETLSISREAYNALLAGADPNALKSASVIQRWLKKSNADESMISYASQQKVEWDIWLRNARHIYSPMDLSELLKSIDDIYEKWSIGIANFGSLNILIKAFMEEKSATNFSNLTRELILGAICSLVVRRNSR